MPRAYEDWAVETEARVLDEAIPLAATLGWNGALVEAARRAAGLSQADAELLLPKGASDLAALFVRRHDDQALEQLAKIDITALKIRERIHTAVETRIEVAMADEAATKACRRYLAMPPHIPLALRLGWETADKLWRWAGDEATDENHYTKRVILGAIIATTMMARMMGGPEHARKHLSDRIDQVMAFEKWKGTGAPRPSQWGEAAARWFGALRYGHRRPPAA